MSRRVSRVLRKSDVGAPASRSFVAPSSSDTFVFPVDSTGLAKNAAVEYSTRVGSNGRVVVIPYSGSSSSNAVSLGSSALQVNAPETAAANNLTVEAMAKGVNAYYVAFLHSGASVTFGSKTYVNPNTNVDSTTAPTERSTQVIVVRYSLTHAVQDSFALTGVAHADRRDVQTQIRIAHYAGVPNAVYVTGRFKGLLSDNSGNIVTSAVNGQANTAQALFCVRVEQNPSSSALAVDWMNTMATSQTGDGNTSAVNANGDVVVDDMGNAFVAALFSLTRADDGVLSATSVSSSSGATFTQAISGTLTASAEILHVFKLLAPSGVADQTHSGNVAGTPTTSSETFRDLLMCNQAANVLALVRGGASNALTVETFDVSNGASTDSTTLAGDSDNAVAAFDATNNWVYVAYKDAGANNFSVSQFKLTSASDLGTEVVLCNASNFGLSTAVQELSLAGLEVAPSGSSTNVYLSFDYALTSSTVYMRTGNTTATNSTLVLPITGGAAAYNSAVLSAVTDNTVATTDDNSWNPQSLAHFDQPNAAAVGNNRLRGAVAISSTQLALGLGFHSDMAYTDGSGTVRTLNGNTGTSISLSRGSSNAVVLVNMSASENENRALGLFDSYNSGNTTCNVRPFTAGKLLSFSGTSTTLSAGSNYYLAAATGAWTTTDSGNLLVGVAVSSSELLITNNPTQ